MWCIVSNATSTLSVISLLGTKALWELLTTPGRIFLGRFAKTLARILYITLHRLIGRYSVTFWGFFVFGMRQMWVSFSFGGMSLVFRILSTQSITSYPTMLQYFWKKSGGIPSRPRDLVGCIWCRACRTSSGRNSFSRELFISSVTLLSMASVTGLNCEGWSDW